MTLLDRDLPCSVASPSWNLAGMRRHGILMNFASQQVVVLQNMEPDGT